MFIIAGQRRKHHDGAWWLAGGVTPIQACTPIGAADIAASYTNLANPGTYDLIRYGTAPSWSTTNGWDMNDAGVLKTGIVVGSGYTLICKFKDAPTTATNRVLFGAADTSDGTGNTVRLHCSRGTQDQHLYYYGGTSFLGAAPRLASGCLGMAGTTAYRDGSSDGTIPGGSLPTSQLWLGAINANNIIVYPCQATITSWWIAASTLNATQMAAQMAAMP